MTKEGLKPHSYPAKRVSIGPRQMPKAATEPADGQGLPAMPAEAEKPTPRRRAPDAADTEIRLCSMVLHRTGDHQGSTRTSRIDGETMTAISRAFEVRRLKGE
jgi:hypothetical protein